MTSPADIRVECYSGYRDEETPRAVWLGSRRVEVAEMLDRWIAPDHRYFKFRGDDACMYIIRQDVMAFTWQLTFFRDRDVEPPADSGSPSGNA